MSECVTCPTESGHVGVVVSGMSSNVKVRGKKDAERSLQLLTSYLAFCFKRNIDANTALDILEACRADLSLSGAHSNAAFVDAFYFAADLGIAAEA